MALAAPKRLLDCSHRVWVLVTDKGRWHRFATPVHAQPAAPGQPPRTAVSIDQSAVFDVTPVTGALKETVQKGQRLVWRARRSPNDRRFELTDMSVAFLRSDAPTQVKITFAGHVSAFGWRPVKREEEEDDDQMAVRTEKTRRSPSKSGGEKKPRVIEARGQ